MGKPLDKSLKVWYNKGTKGEENLSERSELRSLSAGGLATNRQRRCKTCKVATRYPKGVGATHFSAIQIVDQRCRGMAQLGQEPRPPRMDGAEPTQREKENYPGKPRGSSQVSSRKNIRLDNWAEGFSVLPPPLLSFNRKRRGVCPLPMNGVECPRIVIIGRGVFLLFPPRPPLFFAKRKKVLDKSPRV